MAVNLMEVACEVVGSEFATAAARVVGESPVATQSAIASLLPAMIGALALRAASEGGARSILAMLEAPEVTIDTLHTSAGNLPASQMHGAGRAMARSLFRNRLDSVAGALEASTGIKITSATTLIALMLPRVLRTLKTLAGRQQMSETDLASLLAAQLPFVESTLDVRLARILGIASPDALPSGEPGMSTTAARATAKTSAVASPAQRSTASPVPGTFARPAIWLALLTVALLVFFLSQYSATGTAEDTGITSVATTDGTSETRKSAAVPAVDPAPARQTESGVTLLLPGGTPIDVPANGFIVTVVDHLQGSDAPGRGIAFDGLHFNMGSATLEPASQTQIDRLAVVLKAFGSATVAIEGHTDNVGDAQANKMLSQQRAESVKSSLVLHGIADTRITATGYGAEKPRPPAAGETDRAQQRRIELVVVKR